MKKILIIAGKLHIGGAEKVCRDIGLYADREKFTFDYVVYGDDVGVYESQLEAAGCRIFHLPEPSEGYPAHLRALNQLMRENRYHAVHVHTMFSCGWAMLVAKMNGVPVRIAHSHSALADGGGMVKKIYEEVMRTLILTCSTDLVGCGIKAGQRLFGENQFAKRGSLILNGIDVSAFAYDEEKRAAIRAQLGAGDRFILGHSGHLAAVKNQSFLLELMPLVLEEKPDALLLMLGEGGDRPMLEQKIWEMNLQDHVIMTGNVANVADYLSAMDVFVFPSLFEGLPLSILEVQANGLPCVISDGVPEDVFLTDLIRPMSLKQDKGAWLDAILAAQRGDTGKYNRQLLDSDYAVQAAMEKIYRIYEG